MTGPYLLDTDVLIEYLRGCPRAVDFLEGLEGRLLVSAITIAELYSGVRDRREAEALDGFLGAFEALPITPGLAREGGLLRNRFGPSHDLGLADALIAATAAAGAARLVTFNRKHFPMVEDVLVPYTRQG